MDRRVLRSTARDLVAADLAVALTGPSVGGGNGAAGVSDERD